MDYATGRGGVKHLGSHSVRYLTRDGKYAVAHDSLDGTYWVYEVTLGTSVGSWKRLQLGRDTYTAAIEAAEAL